MTTVQIKKKILSYQWKPWLERPFGAFIISLFRDSTTRKFMEKTGIATEYPAFLFERSAWYRSKKAEAVFIKKLKRYLATGGSIFRLTKSCVRFHQVNKVRIKKLIKTKIDVLLKTKEVADIMALSTSYIWLAHGLEDIYASILQKEAKKYVRGDIGKFIGDISFPSKKNVNNLMEQALLKKVDFKSVQKNFGWIKARDGFSDGFSLAELAKLRGELLKNKGGKKRKNKRPTVPKPMRQLVKEAQNLVYFRTLRTDVFYHLLFLSRPILGELAKKYGLLFKDLRDYNIYDLIKGQPKKYSSNNSYICYKGDLVISDKPLLSKEKVTDQTIKGTVAFVGKVEGTVKVVKRIEDLKKVNKGDILVAQMTFPSYIVAMNRAAAFVTDEGGITCHAAIIAREIKKPCVIGTKIATKVLKDGDLVEVDAERGVVEKI